MDNRLIFRYRTGETSARPEGASACEWKAGGKRFTTAKPGCKTRSDGYFGTRKGLGLMKLSARTPNRHR